MTYARAGTEVQAQWRIQQGENTDTLRHYAQRLVSCVRSGDSYHHDSRRGGLTLVIIIMSLGRLGSLSFVLSVCMHIPK